MKGWKKNSMQTAIYRWMGTAFPVEAGMSLCVPNQPLPTFCTFATDEDCRAVETFVYKGFSK